MTHPELEAFATKFRTADLTILETTHWCWSVRPAQPTLGSGVLSLRRYAPAFSDVTADEMADLHAVVGSIEKATQAAFGYEKINYLMLMMKDPHVHFHVIPRYGTPKALLGHTFADAGWPAVPVLAADPAPDAVLAEIQRQLRAQL
jgi:diadenosine tetraphosphate (Ap4A) HIT family hydrolase